MATLDNLKVKDLRQEMEDRDLDTSGKKEDLKKRLSEYLISIAKIQTRTYSRVSKRSFSK